VAVAWGLTAVETRADDRLADLVQRVGPSVVNLRTFGVQAPASSWDLMFGGARRWESLGSGFVVDQGRGLVVTNAHVVKNASEIHVTAWDGRNLEARLLGTDPDIDLAVLQVRGLNLPAVAIGSTRGLRVGEDVFAVGNPYGHGHSVTRGILSARARALGRAAFDLFLQTDAAINPGNSGGPLFDDEGQLVGVNTAIDGRGESLGFAMPVELVVGALPRLAEGKRVLPGWAGLRLEELDDGALRVAAVYPQGPAAQAGIQVGDVVVGLDGKDAWGRAGWAESFAVAFPGDARSVTVRRGSERLDRRLVLEERERWAEQVTGTAVDVEAFGVRVRKVAPDVADRSGLRGGVQVESADRRAWFQAGDIVLEVLGRPIHEPRDLAAAGETALQARRLDATILRDGRALQLRRRW
jgi:serine protease Do